MKEYTKQEKRWYNRIHIRKGIQKSDKRMTENMSVI